MPINDNDIVYFSISYPIDLFVDVRDVIIKMQNEAKERMEKDNLHIENYYPKMYVNEKENVLILTIYKREC